MNMKKTILVTAMGGRRHFLPKDSAFGCDLTAEWKAALNSVDMNEIDGDAFRCEGLSTGRLDLASMDTETSGYHQERQRPWCPFSEWNQ